MTWTEATLTLTEHPKVNPGASPSEFDREWLEVIDRQLGEWEADPDALADEGIEPPSAATVHLAREVARAAKEAHIPPPSRVVVDGAGGVAFERLQGGVYETLLVRKDGSVEMFAFRGATLLSRRKLRDA